VVPKGQYISRFPAGNGWAYCFAWEGYERVRGSIEWGEDRALRIKFLQALVAKGFIPAMTSKLKEVEVRETQKRVRRLNEKFALKPNFPSIKVRLEQAEALLADQMAAAGFTPGQGSLDTQIHLAPPAEADPLDAFGDDDIEPSVVGAPEPKAVKKGVK